MKIFIPILVSLLLLDTSAIRAQTFYRTYNAGTGAYVLDLYATKDSGFAFVAGANGTNTVHKVGKTGSTQWTKTVSISSRRIVQSATGNYFMTDFYNGSRQYVVSLDAAGGLRFVKGYYLGGNQPLSIYNLCPTYEGGYLLCGAANGSPSIIKCDSSGGIIWAKSYSSTATGTFASSIWQIVPAVSGTNYVCQGATAANRNYYAAMEIDGSGSIVWAKDYIMPATGTFNPLSIVRESNGYAMAFSFDGGAADTVHPVYATRMDAAGNPVWTKSYAHNRLLETSHAMAANRLGEIYIGGQQHLSASSSTTSYYQMLLDSNGQVKWASTALGTRTTTPYQYGVVAAASTYNNGFLAGCQAGWDTAPVLLADRTGGGFCNTSPVTITTTAVSATVSSPGFTSFTPAILLDAAVPAATLGAMVSGDNVHCATPPLSVAATGGGAFGASVYPNPTHGTVHVILDSDQWSRIDLIDAQGRVAASRQNTGRTQTADFDVRALSSGVYFLSIRYSNGTAVREKVVLLD